jgi:endonuclease YncB( thermonuclease family)
MVISLAPPLPAAALPAATVLSIADGDTLTVNESGQRHKVRLACIDAPELSQVPYGQTSRQALQALLPLGAQVSMRVKATDRYGRRVAELLKGKIDSKNKSNNINQLMIASGQAFVYWNYISACDRESYAKLEALARLKRLGIWASPGGLGRPWQWRHHQ